MAVSQPTPLQGLALRRDLPADPREAEAACAKAAALVEAFVESQSLPALDAMIQAAGGGHLPDPAVAREASQTAALLDTEVSRFRDLARKA